MRRSRITEGQRRARWELAALARTGIDVCDLLASRVEENSDAPRHYLATLDRWTRGEESGAVLAARTRAVNAWGETQTDGAVGDVARSKLYLALSWLIDARADLMANPGHKHHTPRVILVFTQVVGLLTGDPQDAAETMVRRWLDAHRAEVAGEWATAGPWERIASSVCDWNHGTFTMEWMTNGRGDNDHADGEFIAHARTDVPALVAEVRRLRADNVNLDNATRGALDDLARVRAELEDVRTEAVESERRLNAEISAMDARDEAYRALRGAPDGSDELVALAEWRMADLADARAALRANLRCDECDELATRTHAATARFGCDAHGVGEGWSDTTHAAAVRAAVLR